jgi:hypothetical protein
MEGLPLRLADVGVRGKGTRLIFMTVYFAGTLFKVIVRAPYGRRRRVLAERQPRVTPPDRVVLIALPLGGGVLPLNYALTSRLATADNSGSLPAGLTPGASGIAFLVAATAASPLTKPISRRILCVCPDVA